MEMAMKKDLVIYVQMFCLSVDVLVWPSKEMKQQLWEEMETDGRVSALQTPNAPVLQTTNTIGRTCSWLRLTSYSYTQLMTS